MRRDCKLAPMIQRNIGDLRFQEAHYRVLGNRIPGSCLLSQSTANPSWHVFCRSQQRYGFAENQRVTVLTRKSCKRWLLTKSYRPIGGRAVPPPGESP